MSTDILEPVCDPLDRNDYSLKLVNEICVLLSLVGSIFVILVYTCWKDARSFAYKLILQISISDFIYCMAHFLDKNVSLSLPITPGTLCSIQGFLVNFGMVSSFMWSMVVAWTLFASVVLRRIDLDKKFWIYCIYGYLIPLLTSIM